MYKNISLLFHVVEVVFKCIVKYILFVVQVFSWNNTNMFFCFEECLPHHVNK